MIYLDNAATTVQKPDSVYQAVDYAMRNYASVGRSGHKSAQLAAEHVYRCRILAGQMFDADPEQVVFTGNATHGLNIAIHSMIKPGDRVVISGFEHNAVLRPLHYAGANIVIAGRKLFDQANALEDFDRYITPDTKAVICTHVSNVFGYILPIEQIAQICFHRGVAFILDASQSAGILPVSLKKLNAAYIAMPGHKGLLGPQGTGILLCGRNPKPFMQGGTGSRSSSPEMPDFLPDRAEPGTHNVSGICGLAEGLRHLRAVGLDAVLQHENMLLQLACEALEDVCTIYRGSDGTQSGVLSMQFTDVDCEEAATILASRDIAVRAGMHCAPLAHISAGTDQQGTVRISFSSYTTKQDLEFFLNTVKTDLLP